MQTSKTLPMDIGIAETDGQHGDGPDPGAGEDGLDVEEFSDARQRNGLRPSAIKEQGPEGPENRGQDYRLAGTGMREAPDRVPRACTATIVRHAFVDRSSGIPVCAIVTIGVVPRVFVPTAG